MGGRATHGWVDSKKSFMGESVSERAGNSTEITKFFSISQMLPHLKDKNVITF